MTKGTPSFGRHNKITHIPCRRCGAHAYHMTKSKCANCGFPDSRIKNFKWNWKGVLTKSRKK